MTKLSAKHVSMPQCDEEYAKAFSMAKDALKYISTFRTPPTPEVYEVWYRFVEGGNKAVQDEVSHAVNVEKSINAAQLEQIRKHYLDTSDSSQVNQQITQKLAKEMEGLQSLISSQQGASVELRGAIASASNSLHDETSTPAEIKSCLNTVLQGNERMQEQISNMDSKLRASKQEIEALQNAMLTDPLTGIGNRRLFDSMIAQANEPRTSDAQRHLFLVDLDKFKSINDTYGHATGDEVLRYVASILQKLAVGASIARYGGDEFAVFANALKPEQAKQLADNICQYFFENELTLQRSRAKLGTITISLGAAILRPDDNSVSWFERADKLLYSAKFGGRNRAMVER